MKILRNTMIVLALGLASSSCQDDFLSVKNVEAGVTVDDMYTRYSYAQGVIWEAYSYLPDGLSELWREAATDVAEATSEGANSQLFNLGIWNQFSNPDNPYAHYFKGIDQANRYLANKDKVDIEYIMTNITTSDSSAYYNARNNIKFMEGEANFLKAFFYFELVKRYGGVPIIEVPLDYYNEASWKNLQRNSLDECLKHIVSLCDRAAGIIPQNTATYSWYEDGRTTYGAIKALKARVLLYAASPLYKDAGSSATWAEAAAVANDVIKLNQYNLNTAYAALFGASNATLKEVIFKRRYGAINWVEFDQFPVAFVGSNGKSFAPTQNFVDEFELVGKNGAVVTSEAFNWQNPDHAANPYANRDSRMAATVAYNGMKFKTVTLETFTGGNSGLPKQNATKTGYYLAKWVNTAVDLVNNTSTNHTWVYFRYADVLLTYAEAMLNAYGPDADPENYGLTATQAFNLVRKRAKVSELAPGELNQARIEHERMVELAFEDHRFWDVRRWKKGSEYFGKPVHRLVLTNTEAGIGYEVKKLEDRVYTEKMNWYPIPQSEIVKTGWTQNSGW